MFRIHFGGSGVYAAAMPAASSFQVRLQGAGIRVEIFMRRELRRIHENTCHARSFSPTAASARLRCPACNAPMVGTNPMVCAGFVVRPPKRISSACRICFIRNNAPVGKGSRLDFTNVFFKAPRITRARQRILVNRALPQPSMSWQTRTWPSHPVPRRCRWWE